MKEFKDKVIVITGAASGIGKGLAFKAASEGMKIVLADIEEKTLKRVDRRLKKIGADVLAVVVDVSKADDLETLAKETLKKYGSVHLLFNNAGVAGPKYTWNYTRKDWEWQVGVNLFGVIHGIRVFAPIMMKQDFESRIINTSSVEGLITGSGPGGAIYGLAKHAIVSLSETLRDELALKNSRLKVSVLCPGLVYTKIFHYNRNRPEEFQNDPSDDAEDTKIKDSINMFKESVESKHVGITPEEAAKRIFQAIEDEKFYILTHKDDTIKNAIKSRFNSILEAFD
ncbi:MAG: SDR family NAD(P)-dependent oxidoreductase [Candidatus Hodarchaeota archaeon]